MAEWFVYRAMVDDLRKKAREAKREESGSRR
jgi:hypothetical protein